MGPLAQFFRVRVFQRELVLGTADATLNRQVLHRLHVEFDALKLVEARFHPRDHAGRSCVAQIMRLQIDQHAATV